MHAKPSHETMKTSASKPTTKESRRSETSATVANHHAHAEQEQSAQ